MTGGNKFVFAFGFMLTFLFIQPTLVVRIYIIIL